MFLVVEEKDSTCSLNSVITIFSKVHGTSCSQMQNFTTDSVLKKMYVSVSMEV